MEASVGFSKVYLSCFNFSPKLDIDHTGPVGGIVLFQRGCHTKAVILPLSPLSVCLLSSPSLFIAGRLLVKRTQS